jgi:hypothetical protein
MMHRIVCAVGVVCWSIAALAGSPTGTFELRGRQFLAREQLAEVGATEVRRYEASSVVRVGMSNAEGLTRLAAAAGQIVIPRPEWSTLFLPGGTVSTDERPTGPEYTEGHGLYIVQFDSPLTPQDLATLESHALTHLNYVPHNAVVVAGSGDSIRRVAATAHVQWAGPYEPAYRAYLAPPVPAPVDSYLVQLPDGPSAESTLETLRALAEGPVRTRTVGPFVNVVGRFGNAAIATLRDDPYVVAIERQGPIRLSGEREAIALTGLAQQYANEPYQDRVRPYKPGPDYRTWLSNRGLLDTSAYRVAIVDSGLDGNAASQRPNHPDISRSDIIWQSYVSTDAADGHGHGTLVTGMAVGNPTSTPPTGMVSADADGFFFGMGVAPRTGIYVQKIVHDSGAVDFSTPVLTLANDANYWNASVQTHSYNETGSVGQYTARTQETDLAVRDTFGGDAVDTPMPMTFSAGNIYNETDLRVQAPATAKNVITVGGSESWRLGHTGCTTTGATRPAGYFLAESFENVAWGSRRGTEDGRIKPDIIAPMNLISTTRTQFHPAGGDQRGGGYCINTEDGFYTIDGGTSFSAPQAAGACILLNRSRGTKLSPPMLKAALVGNALSVKNGIDRRTGNLVGPRPNALQGFGRLYLGDAFSGTVTQTYLDETSWTPFTSAGQRRSRTFTVANAALPTVIVLAWSDEPAGIGANPTLVRDLDLTIEVGTDGCFAYTGNRFRFDGSEYSRVQGGPFGSCGNWTYDQANNVEMIALAPNTLTTFTLDIYIASWGFGSHNQKFAVYASNAY